MEQGGGGLEVEWGGDLCRGDEERDRRGKAGILLEASIGHRSRSKNCRQLLINVLNHSLSELNIYTSIVTKTYSALRI